MYKKSLNYLLNKSSAFLNLDTKYFAKAGFYSGIQQGIGVISGIVISYFFGHFIPKNIFGEYNLILSIIGFLTIVTLPGLDSYLTRSIAQKYDSSFVNSVKIKFLVSLIGSPILLGFAYYYSKHALLTTSFIVAAIFFPFLAPLQLFGEFFTAKQKFKELATYISFSSVLSAILVSLSILFSGSLVFILIAYFLGILIPALFATLKILKTADTKSKKIDKELIPFGIFNTALSIIPWLAAYLGQILLVYNFNSELLAIFTVANRLPAYVQKNLFVFYQPVTAKLASQSYTQHIETLKTHSIKLVIWGAILAVTMYLFSPIIITLIFSNRYDEAIKYAQLLSLSVLPLPLGWVVGDINIYHNIKKPRLISTTILNTIKIIFLIVFIPLYNIYAFIGIIIIEKYLDLLLNLVIFYNYNKQYENMSREKK